MESFPGGITSVPSAPLAGLGACGYARWSPNGVNLLFTASSAGYTTRLFRVRWSDGGNLQALTGGTEDDHDTAWR